MLSSNYILKNELFRYNKAGFFMMFQASTCHSSQYPNHIPSISPLYPNYIKSYLYIYNIVYIYMVSKSPQLIPFLLAFSMVFPGLTLIQAGAARWWRPWPCWRRCWRSLMQGPWVWRISCAWRRREVKLWLVGTSWYMVVDYPLVN